MTKRLRPFLITPLVTLLVFCFLLFTKAFAVPTNQCLLPQVAIETKHGIRLAGSVFSDQSPFFRCAIFGYKPHGACDLDFGSMGGFHDVDQDPSGIPGASPPNELSCFRIHDLAIAELENRDLLVGIVNNQTHYYSLGLLVLDAKTGQRIRSKYLESTPGRGRRNITLSAAFLPSGINRRDLTFAVLSFHGSTKVPIPQGNLFQKLEVFKFDSKQNQVKALFSIWFPAREPFEGFSKAERVSLSFIEGHGGLRLQDLSPKLADESTPTWYMESPYSLRTRARSVFPSLNGLSSDLLDRFYSRSDIPHDHLNPRIEGGAANGDSYVIWIRYPVSGRLVRFLVFPTLGRGELLVFPPRYANEKVLFFEAENDGRTDRLFLSRQFPSATDVDGEERIYTINGSERVEQKKVNLLWPEHEMTSFRTYFVAHDFIFSNTFVGPGHVSQGGEEVYSGATYRVTDSFQFQNVPCADLLFRAYNQSLITPLD